MTRLQFLGQFAGLQVATPKPQYAQFTDAEVHLVRDFFRPGGGNPSPARKGKSALDPGVAKQIRRGGTLPERLEMGVLPVDLAKQLPEAPKSYSRVLFHRWILLVESSTRLIVDLIDLP